MSLTLGPFRLVSFSGDLHDLAAGRDRPGALGDLDDRLPQPNSLRRASDDAKAAVLAAVELLRAEGLRDAEKLGIYVGQQHLTSDFCASILDASYREGPRMVSPALFTESVLNNVATHLSLTLRIKGVAQTFVGTRAAALQAVAAAAEDVDSGVVEAALVVGLGVGTKLYGDGYVSVHRPLNRRHRPELRFMRGSVAMLIRRDAPGQPRIVHLGLRCAGRGVEARLSAVRSLWKEAAGRLRAGTRVLESTFSLARERSLEILHRATPTISVGEGLGEGFALDPFVKLLLDSHLHPGDEGRAVFCLGEDGIASMLALDGPTRLALV